METWIELFSSQKKPKAKNQRVYVSLMWTSERFLRFEKLENKGQAFCNIIILSYNEYESTNV